MVHATTNDQEEEEWTMRTKKEKEQKWDVKLIEVVLYIRLYSRYIRNIEQVLHMSDAYLFAWWYPQIDPRLSMFGRMCLEHPNPSKSFSKILKAYGYGQLHVFCWLWCNDSEKQGSQTLKEYCCYRMLQQFLSLTILVFFHCTHVV